jgi:hypothetical protein
MDGSARAPITIVNATTAPVVGYFKLGLISSPLQEARFECGAKQDEQAQNDCYGRKHETTEPIVVVQATSGQDRTQPKPYNAEACQGGYASV